MKFVMTPVGSAGDVHPFIGLGRALRARGHDVVIVTAGTFEQVVQRAGLEFRETISAQFFDVMSKHPDLWHSRRGLQFVLGTVADYLQLGYQRVADVYEPGRTVLVGHALSFGACWKSGGAQRSQRSPRTQRDEAVRQPCPLLTYSLAVFAFFAILALFALRLMSFDARLKDRRGTGETPVPPF